MYKQGNLYKVNPAVRPYNDFIKQAALHNKVFRLLTEVHFDADPLEHEYHWSLTSDFPEQGKKAGYITSKSLITFIPYIEIKNMPFDIEGGSV